MKITIKPSFYLYLLILCLHKYQNCIAILCALTVHEAAHYAVARIIKEPIKELVLMPFGGMMIYKPGCCSSKGLHGIALAIAGPAANYLVIYMIASNAAPQNDIIRGIFHANVSMFLLNMIPATPLDGGAVLFCIGYYLLPIAPLVGVLSWMGVLSGAVLCSTGVLGLKLYGKLNITLLVTGGYLICAAIKSRDSMLVENMYCILQEREERTAMIQPVKLYSISRKTRLFELTRKLTGNNRVLFMCQIQGKTEVFLDEFISRKMLVDPLARIEEIAEKSDINTG